MTGDGRINEKPASVCYDEVEHENILCDIRAPRFGGGEGNSAPHCWPCQLHTPTRSPVGRTCVCTASAATAGVRTANCPIPAPSPDPNWIRPRRVHTRARARADHRTQRIIPEYSRLIVDKIPPPPPPRVFLSSRYNPYSRGCRLISRRDFFRPPHPLGVAARDGTQRRLQINRSTRRDVACAKKS